MHSEWRTTLPTAAVAIARIPDETHAPEENDGDGPPPSEDVPRASRSGRRQRSQPGAQPLGADVVVLLGARDSLDAGGVELLDRALEVAQDRLVPAAARLPWPKVAGVRWSLWAGQRLRQRMDAADAAARFEQALRQIAADPGVDAVMAAIVILSMALTPLLLVLNERVVQPRFGTREQVRGEPITTASWRKSRVTPSASGKASRQRAWPILSVPRETCAWIDSGRPCIRVASGMVEVLEDRIEPAFLLPSSFL